MTKETFIALVRLVKKNYNDVQKIAGDGGSYLIALQRTSSVGDKIDNQLKLIDEKQEKHYVWLPSFVYYARQWRKCQRDYEEYATDSLLRACREHDRILGDGFNVIKRTSPEVLTTPNNQQALFS